jgi:hypothetical protein
MSINSILNLKTTKVEFSKNEILSALNKKFSEYKFESEYLTEGKLEVVSSDLITFHSCNLENFSDNRMITEEFRPNNKNVSFGKKQPSDFNSWDYKLSFNSEFINSTDSHLIKESHHAIGCSTCGEKGKVRCSRCKGNGDLLCPGCQGSKEKKCNKCNGTTQLRCSSCSGTGIKESGYGANKTINRCSYCDGRGNNQCSTCKGGYVTCSTCIGNGRIPCSTCYQSGEVTCHQCDGYKSMDHYFVIQANFQNKEIGLLISFPFPGFDIKHALKNSLNIQNKIFETTEKRFNESYFSAIQTHSIHNQIVGFFNYHDGQNSKLIKSRFTILENKYIEVNFKFYGQNYTVFFDESLNNSFFSGKSPADQYEMDLLNKAISKTIENDLKSAKSTIEKIAKYDFFKLSESELISSIDDTLTMYNAIGFFEEKKYSLAEAELKVVSKIKKAERDYILLQDKLNKTYRRNTLLFYSIGIIGLLLSIFDASLLFFAITIGISIVPLFMNLFFNPIVRKISFSRFFILTMILLQTGITKYIFSEDRKSLACDCYNQSVLKSNMAFDDMSYMEQSFRRKCFDAFGTEANMKFAYDCFPNVNKGSNNDNNVGKKLKSAKKNDKVLIQEKLIEKPEPHELRNFKTKSTDNITERTQMLDELRQQLKNEINQDVVFVVDHFLVSDSFAWMEGGILRKDGTQPKLPQEGMECCQIQALFKLINGNWVLMEDGAFSTDVWYQCLSNRYPKIDLMIFPNEIRSIIMCE